MEIQPTETPTLSPEQQEIADLKLQLIAAEARAAAAEARAAKDPLTGLPSREVVEITLAAELARLRREDEGQLAVVIFDLDHFKKINDSDGHQQGDQVLREFAQKIKGELRETDLLGRWGGEEFMAILPVSPDSTREDINNALERFHQAVRSINRRKEGIDPEPLTVSIGCVIVDQKSATTPEEVFRIADENLYISKKSGRDRSTITPGETPTPTPEAPTF